VLLRYLARAEDAYCFESSPGRHYSTDSYRRCIHRVCDKNAIERWGPHRLRHSAATQIREVFGLDHAQASLGHKSADITQLYADLNTEKASEVARKIG